MFAAIPSESASYLENITEKVSLLCGFEHNFSVSSKIHNSMFKVDYFENKVFRLREVALPDGLL